MVWSWVWRNKISLPFSENLALILFPVCALFLFYFPPPFCTSSSGALKSFIQFLALVTPKTELEIELRWLGKKGKRRIERGEWNFPGKWGGENFPGLVHLEILSTLDPRGEWVQIAQSDLPIWCPISNSIFSLGRERIALHEKTIEKSIDLQRLSRIENRALDLDRHGRGSRKSVCYFWGKTHDPYQYRRARRYEKQNTTSDGSKQIDLVERRF